MMKFNVREEIFFDTVDSFLSEESFTVREDSECGNLSFGFSSNELQSVKERREVFLSRMGFFEESYSTGVTSNRYMTFGVDKVVECSGDATNSYASDENLAHDTRESCDVATVVVEDIHQEPSICPHRETSEHPSATEQLVESCRNIDLDRKVKHWWKCFVHKMKSRKGDKCKVEKHFHKAGEVMQMKVESKKKKCKELTALYSGQEICAHKGLIWTMKFSPDGQYLATGGEDGVLRVWGVASVDASCHGLEGNNSSFRRDKARHASVIVPKKIVQITESPLHEFHGHSSDILDLAWSSSNKLLSASKDNTVRLWHLDFDECQSVFRHFDYVTCIQFNPIDENHFISGSVDGKLRVWGVLQKRVVMWADVHDIITVVCYRPNGKGIVTGSLSGFCRFYEVSGSELLLDAEICLPGKRKSGNKITSIQYMECSTQRVMVTSEDSKICILDGLDIIHKYKGPTKSGSQTSASLTSSGRHILSVGEDSRIYIWNVNDTPIQSSKSKKSTHSCERFLAQGVSVALPCPGQGDEPKDMDCQQSYDHQDKHFSVTDTEPNLLSSCFSVNMSSKSSATWPEEKLPVLQTPYGEEAHQLRDYHNDHLEKLQPRNSSRTWGMVIVTAGWDGMIRTFHNYGLPTKI